MEWERPWHVKMLNKFFLSNLNLRDRKKLKIKWSVEKNMKLFLSMGVISIVMIPRPLPDPNPESGINLTDLIQCLRYISMFTIHFNLSEVHISLVSLFLQFQNFILWLIHCYDLKTIILPLMLIFMFCVLFL